MRYLAILEVASKDEAIEWTRRSLQVAGDGETEIGQLHEAPAYAPESSKA
jgi:hypothetical protein